MLCGKCKNPMGSKFGSEILKNGVEVATCDRCGCCAEVNRQPFKSYEEFLIALHKAPTFKCCNCKWGEPVDLGEGYAPGAKCIKINHELPYYFDDEHKCPYGPEPRTEG